jgi:ABC-type Mn2+/Zn2+ transport system ATPase subunit
MKPLIEFQNVTLGYGRKIVLKGITFSVDAGEYFGLVGPNGAGKTTLVRAILGTLRPLEGEVRVHPPGDRQVRFGYVPQRETIDRVMPYTVREVVMMARYRSLGWFRSPGGRDREIVRQSLAHVSIEGLEGRIFKDLSGGQKQRVLIARALAAEPDVLILDEPTNGMDLSSRLSILDLIQRLHEEGKLTVIMVSHLLDDVANHVKKIAVVEQNFFEVGKVDDVLTVQNLSTLYQMPVAVEHLHGRTIILAGEYHGKS